MLLAIVFPAYIFVAKSLIGHGVVAALGERITTQNAPYGEDCPNEKAAFSVCLNGIG